MKKFRALVLASMVAASLALAPAALAAGKAPQGNGLSMLTDDEHFSNIACDDAALTDILIPAGNTGWAVGETEAHYVLQSIGGVLTATFPDGSSDTYAFSQSYGRKSGVTDIVTCVADYGHTHDGVTESGQMTFVLARTW